MTLFQFSFPFPFYLHPITEFESRGLSPFWDELSDTINNYGVAEFGPKMGLVPVVWVITYFFDISSILNTSSSLAFFNSLNTPLLFRRSVATVKVYHHLTKKSLFAELLSIHVSRGAVNWFLILCMEIILIDCHWRFMEHIISCIFISYLECIKIRP